MKDLLLEEYVYLLKIMKDLVALRGASGTITVTEERIDAQLCLIERMLPNDQDELIALRG